MARTFPAKDSALYHPLRARKVSPIEQPGAHPQDATSPKKMREEV
eukprot:COSAG01_NODE_18779_length_1053_cov_7.659329_1_plen_44_part_10